MNIEYCVFQGEDGWDIAVTIEGVLVKTWKVGCKTKAEATKHALAAGESLIKRLGKMKIPSETIMKNFVR